MGKRWQLTKKNVYINKEKPQIGENGGKLFEKFGKINRLLSMLLFSDYYKQSLLLLYLLSIL